MLDLREVYENKSGDVAQLVRALPCHVSSRGEVHLQGAKTYPRNPFPSHFEPDPRKDAASRRTG
jgi:hypothetical protein